MQYALIALGLGTLPTDDGAWPVFHNNRPDEPDDLIRVGGTAGRKLARIMLDGFVEEAHGIQIMVRSAALEDGSGKAEAVMLALDALTRYQVTVDTSELGNDPHTYLIHVVTRSTGVIPVGKEMPASKRHLHSLNVLAQIEQLT